MSDNALKRLRRLLLLLPVAARAERTGKGIPLARAVEITGARSESELRADIQSVRGLWVDPGVDEDAIDLYVEDGEVHVTYAQAFGTPRAFSLPEGAVLLSVLAPFEKESRALKDATRKLRKAIPEVLRSEADRLVRGLDLAVAPPGPWAGALQEAIEKRVETTIEYRSVADVTVTRRAVEPRLLLQREGHWYLAAWSIAKQDEHLFRLDRIVSAELGTRVFGDHKGPPVSRYGRKRLYFESGAERDVTLRFRGASGRLALTRYGSRARDEGDDHVSVSTKVTPGNYLFGVLLGHGGDVTVNSPPDVVAAFKERVLELARIYGVTGAANEAPEQDDSRPRRQ